MISKQSTDLPFYQFNILSGVEGLFHGVYTRHGGVSRPPYDRLNVAFGVGDKRKQVMRNRALIEKNAPVDRLFFLHQIHDRQVVVLRHEDLYKSDGVKMPPKADAVISSCRHVGLTMQLADCQPVMLVDPKQQVIANVHSGWRGSMRNIIGHTVLKMTHVFGCDPADVLAGIGPSLGPCCAEFVNYRTEIRRAYWRYRIDDRHFDFWGISRDQLLDAGLAAEHIEIGGYCTKCRTDLFFSFRKEKQTGRFAALIALI